MVEMVVSQFGFSPLAAATTLAGLTNGRKTADEILNDAFVCGWYCSLHFIREEYFAQCMTLAEWHRNFKLRMPPNTVKVDRSTAYGNPFAVKDVIDPHKTGRKKSPVVIQPGGGRIFCGSHREAVAMSISLFSLHCRDRIKREPDWLRTLRGKDLACWCRSGEPCHADVLIELANAPEVSGD